VAAIALYFFVRVPGVFALGEQTPECVPFALSFSLTLAGSFAHVSCVAAMRQAVMLSFVGIFVRVVMQHRELRSRAACLSW
jgi:hypothetical protein